MLRNLLRKLRLKSIQAGGDQRSVDNVDALTAAAAQHQRTDLNVVGSPAAPPGYVKTDDGRPPH